MLLIFGMQFTPKGLWAILYLKGTVYGTNYLEILKIRKYKSIISLLFRCITYRLKSSDQVKKNVKAIITINTIENKQNLILHSERQHHRSLAFFLFINRRKHITEQGTIRAINLQFPNINVYAKCFVRWYHFCQAVWSDKRSYEPLKPRRMPTGQSVANDSFGSMTTAYILSLKYAYIRDGMMCTRSAR